MRTCKACGSQATGPLAEIISHMHTGNEAFASVVMRFEQAFDVDHSLVNVNGGSIAMGHPLGATGCMITGTILDELEKIEARLYELQKER